MVGCALVCVCSSIRPGSSSRLLRYPPLAYGVAPGCTLSPNVDPRGSSLVCRVCPLGFHASRTLALDIIDPPAGRFSRVPLYRNCLFSLLVVCLCNYVVGKMLRPLLLSFCSIPPFFFCRLFCSLLRFLSRGYISYFGLCQRHYVDGVPRTRVWLFALALSRL